MFVLIIALCLAMFGGNIYANEPIYSLGFDYPVGDSTRFVSEDGYNLTGGYGYKEKAFYSSCPTLYDSNGNPLNWNIFHPAIDLNSSECPRCDKGEAVYAVSSGVVTYASRSWGGQYNVKIKHVAQPGKAFYLADGARITVVYSLYAHMEKIGVSVGDIVYRGNPIGNIGDYPAGSNSNSHLHFEIRKTNISATTFCGAGSEQFVDDNYVDPYQFISLNRGINIEAGMVFTHNLPKLTPQMPMSAIFMIRNYSNHWVKIRDIVVALEPWNSSTSTWDSAHPIDLEQDTDSTALAPYPISRFFPSWVRTKYHKQDKYLNIADGFYRVVPKVKIRIDNQDYWYDLPKGYSNTKSKTEFSMGNSAENFSSTTHITDLNVKQLTSGEYEANWTAPGKATVVASALVTSPVSSYEIRIDNAPLNKSNFRNGTLVRGDSPKSAGNEETLRFSTHKSPVYMAIAEDNNLNKLSNIEFVSPDCHIPSAISNIHSGEVTDYSIELLWDRQEYLDYIEIWRRMDGESEFSKRDTLAPAAIRYVDSGLTSDTQYAYVIVPFNACGAGDVSSVFFRSTEETPEIPPAITYPDLVITDLQVPPAGNIDSFSNHQQLIFSTMTTRKLPDTDLIF